jgi:colanic acid biosynthesis glycosyl transferase WcaI
MHLLIISMHYAPEPAGNAPYVTGFAEHLARSGHQVAILTGVPHYPYWQVFPGFRTTLWRHESRNGVAIYRRRHYVPRNPSATHRAIAEATSLLTGIAATSRFSPQAVLGVVPTISDGLLAARIARQRHVPYGLIFQDLVARGAAQTGVGRPSITPWIAHLERRMATDATAIGIVAEGFRPYLQSLGVQPSNIYRLRNWSLVNFPRDDSATEIRKQLALSDDTVLCLHAGNMGSKQALQNIIDCATLAQSDPRLRFLLMGSGNQRAELQRLVEQRRLSNVRFMDPQRDEVFAQTLGAADLLILNQRSGLTDVALPSKLTAYFAAGRPIVAAVEQESEAAQEIRASGGGIVCRPEQPAMLLAAIHELAASNSLCAQLAANGRSYADKFLMPDAALAAWSDFVTRLTELAFRV